MIEPLALCIIMILKINLPPGNQTLTVAGDPVLGVYVELTLI